MAEEPETPDQEPIRTERQRQRDEEAEKTFLARVESFRLYLKNKLTETGISARRLSLDSGQHETFYQVILAPPPGRKPTLPTPDELRLAQKVLAVPLPELLEQAWGITPSDVDSDMATVAAHSGVCAESRTGFSAEELADLSVEERDEVRNFLAYVRAKRAMRDAKQAPVARGRRAKGTRT